MDKITKLTPAQEKELPIFREYWRSIGLSTEPIDHKNARECVNELYAAADLDKPKMILIFSSPLMCLLAKGLFNQLRGQLWDQLRGQLWDQLRGQLWDQLRGQLWDQ